MHHAFEIWKVFNAHYELEHKGFYISWSNRTWLRCFCDSASPHLEVYSREAHWCCNVQMWMVKIWKIMSVPLGNWALSLSICCITVMHDHVTAQLHRCPTGKTKNMSEADGRGDRNHFMRQTYSSHIFPGAFQKCSFLTITDRRKQMCDPEEIILIPPSVCFILYCSLTWMSELSHEQS